MQREPGCSRLRACMHAAPEVLRGGTYDAKRADVWSSGVMLYAMLCCNYPFERPDDEGHPQSQLRIVQRIVHGEHARL